MWAVDDESATTVVFKIIKSRYVTHTNYSKNDMPQICIRRLENCVLSTNLPKSKLVNHQKRTQKCFKVESAGVVHGWGRDISTMVVKKK